MEQRAFSNLQAGDPAPWFRGRTASNPNDAFDTAPGRYLVLCFCMTSGDQQRQAALNTASATTGSATTARREHNQILNHLQ